MAALRRFAQAEYEAWLPTAIEGYAEDRVASGQWLAHEATERSRKEHSELLPEGLATQGNYLYSIITEDGEAVGMLWFAEQQKFGRPVAYVYNIEVYPPHRRKGHAVRALRGLEAECLRLGLQGIALHVFGHNRGARALYAKLGYEPTNLNLFKPIVTGA